MRTRRLSPWLQGMDNVNDVRGAEFQLPGEGMLPARLAELVNCVLDAEGVPELRPGLTEVVSGTTCLGGFSGLGQVWKQDGGTIYKVDVAANSRTSAVTGLNPSLPVKHLEHAGRLLYTNGEAFGELFAAGTAGPWGLDTPPVANVRALGGGSFPAGQYLVAATLIDALGVEHTANKSAVVTLIDSQNIQVELSSVDENAVWIKWYCSLPDTEELFWSKTVAATTLRTTIDSIDVSMEQIRTQAISPPLPARCLASYRGMVLLAVDNAIYPSLGPFIHLYEIDRAHEYFPDVVQGCVGLDPVRGSNGGFWTITSNQTFWTTGAVPEEFDTITVGAHRDYAAGGIRISGTMFPKLGVSSDIAVFLSEDGPVAGLPGGDLVLLAPNQIRHAVRNKDVTFAFWRFGSVNNQTWQILWALR